VALKLLLDTHTVVWWWLDDPRLPARARATIADAANTVHVSAVSAWEVATKSRLGEWPDVDRIADEFPSLLRRSRFAPMPISVDHARMAGALAGRHRDPFDRMLIAQSKEENATLVSRDAVFREFAVDVIWE
jgi:PIN domain nuclease of toxin-antitoxin system